jgi:hypothetical protein
LRNLGRLFFRGVSVLIFTEQVGMQIFKGLAAIIFVTFTLSRQSETHYLTVTNLDDAVDVI